MNKQKGRKFYNAHEVGEDDSRCKIVCPPSTLGGTFEAKTSIGIGATTYDNCHKLLHGCYCKYPKKLHHSSPCFSLPSVQKDTKELGL
jgi:hypothetical protein